MSFQIPSIYWPIAEMGFSRSKTLRRAFRRLFCRLYRKQFWNPVMNSWTKTKGFDHRRHLWASNTHAVCSAVVLATIVFFLYFAHRAALSGLSQAQHRCYVWAAGMAVFELVYNAGGIVLSRYLYLLTLRRPGLTKRCSGPGPRVSCLSFERRHGAAPAVYEQAVVKLERVVFGGLIPTVYSASRLRRRHFSFCEADLTH